MEFLDAGINPYSETLDFLRDVSVQGAPLLPNLGLGGGKVFYLDPTNGSDNNSGRGPTNALATMTKAISKCVSNRGDVIVRMPGTETVTATVTQNKVGITIIGTTAAGNIETPASYLMYNSTTGPALTITAACTIIGMAFRAIATPATNPAVLVSADKVVIKRCLFQHLAGAIVGVQLNGIDDTLIEGCIFKDYDAAGDSPINLVINVAAVCNRTVVRNCRFINNVQCIEHQATALPSDFLYEGNTMIPAAAGTYFLQVNTLGAVYGLLCNNNLTVANNDLLADINLAGLQALGVQAINNHYLET